MCNTNWGYVNRGFFEHSKKFNVIFVVLRTLLLTEFLSLSNSRSKEESWLIGWPRWLGVGINTNEAKFFENGSPSRRINCSIAI
ncbi:hypothetical protein D3C84_929190 [compost metagenome]